MILVTGGTGLVGSHLLYHLSLQNDMVRAIHRKNSDLNAVKNVFSYYSEDFESLFQKIEWVEADITDINAIGKAFKNVTHVYHSAALVSFDPKDYKAMRKINIEGTSNIVNFCVDFKVQKLCFVSSVAAIEKSFNKKIIDENEAWSNEMNNHGYAITKYGAEMEVWRASQEGVPVVIVNPGIILGPGFWKNGSGAIFSKIDKGLKFYSEGVAGFVGVQDVVNIMKQLMQSKIENERFILVSENKSFKDVFFLIADHLNKKRPTIEVSRFMSAIGWRLEKIRSFLTGNPPLLTVHSAKSIHNKYYFSSEKVIEALHYNFEMVTDTVEMVCKHYRK